MKHSGLVTRKQNVAVVPYLCLLLSLGVWGCDREPAHTMQMSTGDRAWSRQERQGVQKRLLSFGQYQRRVKGKPPFTAYRLACGAQTLTFCGVRHSTDPADVQFIAIEILFDGFFTRLGPAGRGVVVVEGGVPQIDGRTNRNAIISRFGERGRATALARRHDIFIRSGEPQPETIYRKQVRRFGATKVQLAYLARRIGLWQRRKRPCDLDTFMARSRLLQKLNIRYDRADFVKKYEKTMREKPDFEDPHYFARITNPAGRATVLNTVLARDTALRDIHLVALLGDLSARYKHVFVVFGVSHAVMIRSALRWLWCRRWCRSTQQQCVETSWTG
jgi:hypothetical protein